MHCLSFFINKKIWGNNYVQASQSIESIAKIIMNAKFMKETFPETFKE